MQKTFRLFISLLLILLLTVQCFAAAVPLAEADAPDTAAPVVSLAQVRSADSETVTELKDGMVLEYNAAVFHFAFADPAGEDGAEPAGVDLAACAVYADERLMSEAAADETDSSLSVNLTFANGRHVLRVLARDLSGNESETVYTIQVSGKIMLFPEYSVTPEPDYAPLGSSLRLVVRTSDAMYLSVLNVCLVIDPAFAPAYTIEAAQGFSLVAGSENYDASTGTLRFGVKANVNLTGEREIAAVSFAIDRKTAEGTVLTYSVPGAWAETRRADVADYLESFSFDAQSVSVQAPIVLTVDDLYTGMTTDAYFHAKDRSGSPVRDTNIFRADGSLIGRTNWSGILKVPASLLAEPGMFTVYAEKEGVGASFPLKAVVTDPAGDDAETGVTFRVISGATGSKSVSWISSFHDTVYLRYAERVPALEGAEALKADFTRVPVGTQMAQINRITLTGLTPGSTYYLQTSYDGVSWSAVRSFAASDLTAVNRFFVLGDLAGAPTEQRTELLRLIAWEDMPLGVLTGDLVTDAASLDQWVDTLKGLADLGDPDLLFAPGEQDLSDGGAAFTGIAGQPDGCFSVESGYVYFAVIPYRADQNYRADLDWLARDAARSSCPWKVLVMHQPVYAACAESKGLETRFPQELERAGIQFVFSGHDQVYARTPALQGGQTAESYDAESHTSYRGDGVVYYLCGSAGAHERETSQTLPEGSVLRNDLTASFLLAEVTQDHFTVRALDGEGNEIDRYTVQDSPCVKDGHVFSESSRYHLTGNTIVCDRCGRAVPAVESGYTGFAALDGSGRCWLDQGYVRTGWFTAKGVLYHAGEDARVHQTVAFSTETCTEPGERMAWCTECRETHSQGVTVPASGHDFDENHRCKNIHYDADHRTIACGWRARNLADLTAELEYRYGFYTGEALTPSVTVLSPSGEELDNREYTVEYSNNVNLGVASVILKAVNSYYGTLTLQFEIRPGETKTVSASGVTSSGLTLSWSAAPGAQRYAVYQQTGENWKRLGDTAETTYAVSALSPGTSYTFRVRPYAVVSDTAKRLDGSTDRTYWAPHYSESVTVKTEGIRFVDVPDDAWFADAVNWAVDKNVTQGTGDNRFSPDAQCTRGQMVTFLWRAKGCPEPTQSFSPFDDVSDPSAYYYKAVLWAVENGITRGSSATTFSPNAPVTRGMVVTFLHRAAGDTPPARSDSPFVDVEGWQYYAQSVQWAVEQKITSGMDATHFSPDTICTRAQIVTFLYRLETRG